MPPFPADVGEDGRDILVCESGVVLMGRHDEVPLLAIDSDGSHEAIENDVNETSFRASNKR